jgi:hypothetical protein
MIVLLLCTFAVLREAAPEGGPWAMGLATETCVLQSVAQSEKQDINVS